MPDDSPLINWAWSRLNVGDTLTRVPPVTKPVVIAVVDSGVDVTHRELAPSVLPPLTVLGADTRDDDDHGTLIAGTIASVTRHVIDTAGAPGIKILPVKFYSQQVFPAAAHGAAAIDKAVLAGAKVIVLAWDCGHDSRGALKTAIEAAGRADVSVVAAAGNQALDNDRHPNWPAVYGSMDHVITVMATDHADVVTVRQPDLNDERPSFSNYGGKTVHVGAPGVAILSTVPYFAAPSATEAYAAGYRYYRGTSPATAYVAGLAALIRAQNPGWTAAQVKARVIASAQPLPGRNLRCVTQGIVDYARAL